MNGRKKERKSEKRADERMKKRKKEKPTNNYKIKMKVFDRIATLEELKEAK